MLPPREGDRVTYGRDGWGKLAAVRIERPVPTTCTCPPISTSQETEPDEHCPLHGRLPSPHPPTREQIADRLIERLRNSGGWSIDEVWQRWQNLFVEYDRDLALALIQNGADR